MHWVCSPQPSAPRRVHVGPLGAARTRPRLTPGTRVAARLSNAQCVPLPQSLCVGGTVGTAIHTLMYAALVWRIDWQETVAAQSRLSGVANVATKLLASSARAKARKLTAPLSDGLLSSGLTAVGNPLANLSNSMDSEEDSGGQ